MQINMPACSVIATDDFVSKKGTRCGVLRWFDLTEGKPYRTMVFGDDCDKLKGLVEGEQVSVLLDLRGSRRDDTVEVYLSSVLPALA